MNRCWCIRVTSSPCLRMLQCLNFPFFNHWPKWLTTMLIFSIHIHGSLQGFPSLLCQGFPSPYGSCTGLLNLQSPLYFSNGFSCWVSPSLASCLTISSCRPAWRAFPSTSCSLRFSPDLLVPPRETGRLISYILLVTCFVPVVSQDYSLHPSLRTISPRVPSF